MKRLFLLIAAGLALLTFGMIGVSSGCSSASHEGFAIYLGGSFPIPQPAMGVSGIGDKPIISLSDIVAYNPQTHKIILTNEAASRVSSLQVSTSGLAFIVCVDKKPIYAGAFWTPISSQSFQGVTIMQWKPIQVGNIIKLELGYPAQSFYNGTDLRSDPQIIASLDKAGKLSSMPPPPTITALESSMKGWELYSWQEQGQWHFTLMYGTNRLKNLEEIISIQNTPNHVHVVGVEAIKNVLKLVPRGEWVSWRNFPWSGQTQQTVTALPLPSKDIIDAIEAQAALSGLNLYVEK